MEQGKTQEINISDLKNFTEYYFEVNVTDEVANITDVATIKTYCKGISCPGEKAVTVSCTKCSGSGKETVSTQCRTCWGDGYTYADCSRCSGSGKVSSPCPGKAYISTTWTEPCLMTTCNGSGTLTRYRCDTCGVNMADAFRCTTCGYSYNMSTHVGSSCHTYNGPKVTCPICNGSGDGDETTCTNCRGSGSVSTTQTCTTCKGDKTVTTTTKCDHDCTSQHYYCTEHGNNVSEYHE